MSGAKLVKDVVGDQDVLFMEDGEVAIITAWTVKSYIGTIVQRCGQSLIAIGKSEDECWPNLFKPVADGGDGVMDRCKVRILRAGTTIELT
jgi:hypothetical protein